MKNSFRSLSAKISQWTGSPIAFILAGLGILVWFITGPYFHFSNTWLIAIATITDIVIFLMVFLLQNSQNRDSKAIQLKLNELISADQKARAEFIGLETWTDNELAELDEEFQQLLTRLDAPQSLHKLHKTIKHEKAKRPGIYKQAEHLVDNLLSPLSGKHD
jgi:low affinity Fe/Cu permease